MIRYESFDPTHVEAHIDVAKDVYAIDQVVRPDHVIWKHANAPFGPSLAIEIEDKDDTKRLIGRSFLARRPFVKPDGTYIRGATVTDLVIRPENRSALHLIKMVKATKNHPDFDIVVHSSNEVSDVFYRGMFKFPVRFSLASAALPVRLRNILVSRGVFDSLARAMDGIFGVGRLMITALGGMTRRLAGLSFTELPNDDVLDDIHSAHQAHAGAQFLRDRDFMQWRYRDGPISRSELTGLWKGGTCLGYIATRSAAIEPFGFTLLMDMVTRRPLRKIERIALQLQLARTAIRNGSDAAFVMYNPESPAMEGLGKLPFVLLPDTILPHPTPIFVHTDDPDLDSDALRRLYITLADLDYF